MPLAAQAPPARRCMGVQDKGGAEIRGGRGIRNHPTALQSLVFKPHLTPPLPSPPLIPRTVTTSIVPPGLSTLSRAEQSVCGGTECENKGLAVGT